MPELVTLMVPVTSLAKGDTTDWGTVDTIDRKVKYSYVTMAETGQAKRLEVDAHVRVLRSQPTQAEKDAQLREYRLQAIDRKEQSAQAALADVQAKVVAELGQGNHLYYSRLDDLLSVQATAVVWARVTHVAQVQANRAVAFDAETGTWSVRPDEEVAAENDGHPALDRVAVYEHVKDLLTQQLLEYPRFTSRSTSIASNLIEDYTRQAQAEFVSRNGYWF